MVRFHVPGLTVCLSARHLSGKRWLQFVMLSHRVTRWTFVGMSLPCQPRVAGICPVPHTSLADLAYQISGRRVRYFGFVTQYFGFVSAQSAAEVQCADWSGNANFDAAITFGTTTAGSNASLFICTLHGNFMLSAWRNCVSKGQAQARKAKWKASGIASAELGTAQAGMYPVNQLARILGLAADTLGVGPLHLHMENTGVLLHHHASEKQMSVCTCRA